MLYEGMKRAYQIYDRLDPEMKRAASEIAAKYPYPTEYVAEVIVANGFDIEKAEEKIKQGLLMEEGLCMTLSFRGRQEERR